MLTILMDIVVLLTVETIGGLVIPGGPCSEGWVLRKEVQQCYFASPVDDLRTFNESANVCSRIGAVLSTQHNDVEKRFFDQMIQQCPTGGCESNETNEFWIGLVKPRALRGESLKERRSGWRWLDGTPYNYSSWSNWDETAPEEQDKEPNNGDTQVRLTFHGFWADKDTGYKCRYVCKKDLRDKSTSQSTDFPNAMVTATESKSPPPQNPKTSEPSPTESDGDPSSVSSLPYSPSEVNRTLTSSTSRNTTLPLPTARAVPTVVSSNAQGNNLALYIGSAVGVVLLVTAAAAIVIGYKIVTERRKEKEIQIDESEGGDYAYASISERLTSHHAANNYYTSGEDKINKPRLKEKIFKEMGGVGGESSWSASVSSSVPNPYQYMARL